MPPADRDWFDTLVGVASVFNTLVLTSLLVVMVPAVVAITRNLKQLRDLLDRAYSDLGPLTASANRIAANVEEISESVKDEVLQVKETVGQATRGLHNAVESTERRLRDLGALMDVAQGEAERIVLGTAAAAHSVRASASSALGDDDGEDLLDGDSPQRRSSRPQVRSRRKRAG